MLEEKRNRYFVGVDAHIDPNICTRIKTKFDAQTNDCVTRVVGELLAAPVNETIFTARRCVCSGSSKRLPYGLRFDVYIIKFRFELALTISPTSGGRPKVPFGIR